MDGKLLSIENFDHSGIILKPPTQIGSCYLSEILYLDKKDTEKTALIRPIFKTPRLRIKYGAKRFSENTSYGYCLNMTNKDIDPEINEFYTFIKNFDKAIISVFTESQKSWNVRPTKCMKYRTAMKRKTANDEFYFQVKLIDDIKNKEFRDLATVIYNSNRTKAQPEDIVYGKYADQFICPAYLYYDETGIHSVWQAHQILLSNIEKVFLEHCILDHINPTLPPPFPFPPPPPPFPHPFPNFPQQPEQSQVPIPIPIPNPNPNQYTQTQAQTHQTTRSVILQINPSELKSVIKNLRKSNIREDD